MKSPSFSFYSSDFLIGCADLTHEEIGMYIKLLCYQHQKGRLTQKQIGLFLGFSWVSLSDELKSKFKTDENGLIFNARLEREIDKKGYFLEKQRENGKKGGRPKKKNNPNDNPNETQNKAKRKAKENPKKGIEDEDVIEDVIEIEEKGVTGEKTKKADFQKFVEDFNLLRKSKFRANKQLEQKFYQRISEGYTPDDILNALKIALQDEFHKNSEYRYITVEFMLRYDKLDKFLNTKINANSQKHNSGNSRPTTDELNAAVEAGIALASAAHNG